MTHPTPDAEPMLDLAAILDDFRFLGIEREAEYVAIAEARITKASEQPSLWGAL